LTRYGVLIVGSGHAGAQAAIALRQLNYTGSVAMLSAEADPPYERPPLSKDYLAGDKPLERILIRPAAFWADRGIERLPGREVFALDPAARKRHLRRWRGVRLRQADLGRRRQAARPRLLGPRS
jgi:3-phenylpropionate/trans-cinnamate dioxygenase ferredoxin reductase component